MDFSPVILTIMLLYLDASAQHQNQNVRVAPGVPPQHYDQNQQYMQPPQHHNQFQQHQVPQHHQHQPPPGQHQGFQQPMGQVPVQLQPQHGIPQHGVPQHAVPQHQPPPGGHGGGHGHAHGGGHGQGQLLDTSNIANERQHIQEHMDVPIDTSQMTEQELQFHYFKMHDADNNNKLDGCELVKSLIHWHDQANHDPRAGVPIPEPKVFKDDELIQMIDPILENDDKNRDGFIDYGEFVQAQATAASKNPPPKH